MVPKPNESKWDTENSGSKPLDQATHHVMHKWHSSLLSDVKLVLTVLDTDAVVTPSLRVANVCWSCLSPPEFNNREQLDVTAGHVAFVCQEPVVWTGPPYVSVPNNCIFWISPDHISKVFNKGSSERNVTSVLDLDGFSRTFFF